jgi:hypothetical protein
MNQYLQHSSGMDPNVSKRKVISHGKYLPALGLIWFRAVLWQKGFYLTKNSPWGINCGITKYRCVLTNLQSPVMVLNDFLGPQRTENCCRLLCLTVGDVYSEGKPKRGTPKLLWAVATFEKVINPPRWVFWKC